MTKPTVLYNGVAQLAPFCYRCSEYLVDLKGQRGEKECPKCKRTTLNTVFGFFGKWRALSNFQYHEGWTVEHRYQASKTSDEFWRQRILKAENPGVARRIGQEVPIRPDWEEVKLHIMEQHLREKFRIPEMRGVLMSTGVMDLEEGNWWKDRFWGINEGKGENNLGKLLMRLRFKFSV